VSKELFANSAQSALVSSIGAADTTLSVLSATKFPSSGNFRILIDTELLLVTAVAGTTFTVTRGAESTTAAAHAAGATVTHVLTAGSLAVHFASLEDADTFNAAPLTIVVDADANKGLIVRAHSGTQSANLQEWQTSGGSARAQVTAAGEFSYPTPSTDVTGQNEAFGRGAGASAAGHRSTFLGYNAGNANTGNDCTIIGANASSQAANNNSVTAIGSNVVGADNAVTIGANVTGAQQAVVIGSACTGSNISVAIGLAANASQGRSAAIGRSGTSLKGGDFAWGDDSNTRLRYCFSIHTSNGTQRYPSAVAGEFADNTDANNKGRSLVLVFDFNSLGDGAGREAMRAESDGTQPLLGFYGVSAVARQLLATGAGHTVDDVIGALQSLGLLRQS
jgi:hypothetical protein